MVFNNLIFNINNYTSQYAINIDDAYINTFKINV